MNGVLILDKPQDFTSFDAVAVVRKLFHTKRVGHTGTLDPMATGVLPILIGSATRAADILPDSNKAYRAHFRLGLSTDTQDSTGKILSESALPVSREMLDAACVPLRGDILQIPPMYSAIKRNGVPLYDLARQGIEVEREARPIHISTLTVEEYDPASRSGILYVECSKGTYIRTLIADIGNSLGCGGIMTALRRTFACGFPLSDAVTVENLRTLAETDSLEPLLRPTETLFLPYPIVRVTERQAVRFSNGGELDASRLPLSAHTADGALFRVHSPTSLFLGLGRFSAEQHSLSVFKIFS